MELKNKNITVVGMGRTGIATANFLIAKQAFVSLIDSKPREELEEAICSLKPEAHTFFECSKPPANCDLIVLSPGVDIHSSFLKSFHKQGTEIISEIELASRFTQIPIIAVTGTNGKSTVTTLIGNILKQAGKNVAVGGNLGTPFISLLDQKSVDYFVLEVSTFQLEGVKTFRPHIAVILNISPDHLDRHKTFEDYAALKGKISNLQTKKDFLVLNRDDANAMAQGKRSKAKKLFFSLLEKIDKGAYLDNNLIVSRVDETKESLFSVNELHPTMQCQIENLLCAVAVTSLVNVTSNDISEAAVKFTGLEHRIELVRTVHGIDFINDSKGTNVGSLDKSLKSFSRPIILIAGGKDKGENFRNLKEVLKNKVKHLVLLGETKTKFRQILNGSFSYEDAESMEDAVGLAVKKAREGDIVLLSPGCASFDMFQDFAERGNRFKEIVNQLK